MDEELNSPVRQDEGSLPSAGLTPKEGSSSPGMADGSSRCEGGLQQHELVYDKNTLLQAVVFIEDAVMYRSIHHKVDLVSLKIYRCYFSYPVNFLRHLTIFLVHILVVFEFPSSLSWSSNVKLAEMRITLSCGVTESVEMVCLILLATDMIIKTYLMGFKQFLRSKWMIAYLLVIAASIIDWSISIGLGCHETIRLRRMLRPFFILQNSSLMKKIVNCLRRTLPEVASILLLLGFHLYVFSLIGMLIFPKPTQSSSSEINITMSTVSNSTPLSPNVTQPPINTEEILYFKTLWESFISLLVLLTTANNPDVMMPAYNENRLYFLYFGFYLLIGLYCFMNMLTAVVYNQFRGYFLNSMQASLFRRRVAIRAAFEVLRQMKANSSPLYTVSYGVEAGILHFVLEMSAILKNVKNRMLQKLCGHADLELTAEQFQEVFHVLDKEISVIQRQKPPVLWVTNPTLQLIQKVASHNYFTYFGNAVAFVNVVLLTVELSLRYNETMSSAHNSLMTMDLVFIMYYLSEQCLKFWALGWQRFISDHGNMYDSIITFVLVILELVILVIYGTPFSRSTHAVIHYVPLWNLIRVTNILIIMRLVRIIPHIKALSLVTSTLLDLVHNLKAFAGILIVIFYSYAILGIELFQGKIKYSDMNDTNSSVGVLRDCGSYQQLEYWANNFDDFVAAIVVLWDIMVVNNWHVFLTAYGAVTSRWSYLYFIVWWLVSAVIVMNLLMALILENFIMKWDKNAQQQRNVADSDEDMAHLLSVHEMFRGCLQEPAEEELVLEIRSHAYLNLER